MKYIRILLFLGCAQVIAQAQQTETIVMIRHGEKPKNEIGQLDCQGLNRALGLYDVLTKKYPNPKFILAPDTADQIEAGNQKYSYIRPLITIAPTAIRLGLPINAQIGFTQIGVLETELLKEQYRDATVYVAWEHNNLHDMVVQMLKDLKSEDSADPWPPKDFDSIFVLTIVTDASGNRIAHFKHDQEGLSPGKDCPQAPSN